MPNINTHGPPIAPASNLKMFGMDQNGSVGWIFSDSESDPYEFIGEYAPSITLTKYKQLVRDENGEFWRVSGQVDLPYVTTGEGLPEDDALVPVGDAVLRQDLANPGMGAALVARGVVCVDGLKGLAAIPPGFLRTDVRYENDGFYVGSTVGGGSWKWRDYEPKSNHNGGTVIDPDRIDVWNGTQGDLATLFTAEVSGTGCFVQIKDNSEIDIECFGYSTPQEPSDVVFSKAIEVCDSVYDLVINFDLLLTTHTTKTVSDLKLRFKNGAKIIQPTPSSWSDQRLVLTLLGGTLTTYDLAADGLFNNVGLNEVPSPVNKFIQINTEIFNAYGRTSCVNSGGYGVDITSKEVHMDFGYVRNNAYSGMRYAVPSGARIFHCEMFDGRNVVGPIGRRTGLTVNGQNDIPLLKFGYYKGHNATLFTEAATSGPEQYIRYYKKIEIDQFELTSDQDVQYPNGDPASNTIGKMENYGVIRIGSAYFRNDCPSSGGQNVWFGQGDEVIIDHLDFDGTMRFPKSTKIGHAVFNHTKNTDYHLIDIGSAGSIHIDKLNVNEPDAGTVGCIEVTDVDQRIHIGKYIVNGPYNLPVLRIGIISNKCCYLGNYNEVSKTGYTSHVVRAIYGSPAVYTIHEPQNFVSEVSKGDHIFIGNKNICHEYWVATEGGAVTWSDKVFTGTASFNKVLRRGAYSSTNLNNAATFLTSSDAGLSVWTGGMLVVWNGSKWVNMDGSDLS